MITVTFSWWWLLVGYGFVGLDFFGLALWMSHRALGLWWAKWVAALLVGVFWPLVIVGLVFGSARRRRGLYSGH